MLEESRVRRRTPRRRRLSRRRLLNRRVCDLELLLDWMEGNPYPGRLVVLCQNLVAEQSRHQSRDPLLAIDEDALAGGEVPSFKRTVGFRHAMR